ncbi:MAG TPA: PorV/PorQ family protein [bacterium]|nr:PorV/PorQ family protein [bacterium]
MRKLFSVVIILILINSAVFAKENIGTKGAQFITLGAGGRALGMAGAYVAVENDIYLVHWNPAGLAIFDRVAVGFMEHTLLVDISCEFLAIGGPLKKNHSYIAMALQFGRYGKEARTTYLAPYGTGESFDGSDFAVSLSIASKTDFIDRNLRLGATIKYINQEIYDYSGKTFGCDIGGLYKFTDNFSLGANISNIGGRLKFIEKADELPLQLRGGASFNIMNKINANCDMFYTKNEKVDFAIGMELKLIDYFAFRTGFNTVNDAGNGYVFGLGINYNNWNMDYVYEPYGKFDASHKISVDYVFGDIIDTKQRYIKPVVTSDIVNKARVAAQPSRFSEDNKLEKINQLILTGYNAVKNGEYPYAIILFDQAIRLDENNITARLWLAYSLAKLGDVQRAIKEYENVLKLDKFNANALQALKILKR